MSTRRERAKGPNRQTVMTTVTDVQKPLQAEVGAWKENLGKYLIDISKYLVTGVIITSVFKGLDDKTIVTVFAFFIALPALIVGLVLTNKKKEN